jgi:hypothetical protein
VLGELADALRLAGQWERVLPVVDSIRRLREQRSPGAEWHDEIELLEYEARWRVGGDMYPELRRLFVCVDSLQASASHKVRAATQALMLADNLCEVAAAHSVYAAARPFADHFEVDSVSRLHLDLVYHSAFGSLAVAATIARKLISEARQNDSPARRVQLLQHASIALRGAGEFAEAASVLSEAYATAERYALAGAAVSVANSAAWTQMLSGCYRIANWWCERARTWLAGLQDQTAITNVRVTETYLHLIDGDLARAAECLHESSAALRQISATRPIAEEKALRLIIVLRRGERVPTTEELSELRRLHEASRHAAALDLVAFALSLGLTSVGRCGEATELLTEYLTKHRRELYPPPTHIRCLFAAE